MLFRFLLVACLLLSGSARLSAQNFDQDTVRPGIQSVKREICGYGPGGDSTGLRLYEHLFYTGKGVLQLKVTTFNLVMESWPEETVRSWYYDGLVYNAAPGADTTWYVYNAKGQLTRKKFHFRSDGPSKVVYTYDAAGQCTKEEYYNSANQPESWSSFAYNAKGKLIKCTEGNGKAVSVRTDYKYDSRSREISRREERVFASGSRVDSVVTTYEQGKTVISQWGYVKGYTEIYFTEFDSVRTKYIHASMNRGKVSWADTVNCEYDELTHRLTKRTTNKKDARYTELYEYAGGKCTKRMYYIGNLLVSETKYNANEQPVFKLVNNNKGKGKYSTEVWEYNEKGDLVDYKMTGEKDQMVQHEVYTYTYY